MYRTPGVHLPSSTSSVCTDGQASVRWCHNQIFSQRWVFNFYSNGPPLFALRAQRVFEVFFCILLQPCFSNWLTCAKVSQYDLSGSFRQSWGTNSGNWVNWWALARIQLYTSSMMSALSLLHFNEALLFWTTIKYDFSHVTVKLQCFLCHPLVCGLSLVL